MIGLSNQIKSNQTEDGCCNKRILQFEGSSFVNESKKLPEVRKKIMIKTSTAQAKETKKKNKNKTTNKTKKAEKRDRAIMYTKYKSITNNDTILS